MIILGIDPGTRRIGYAFISKDGQKISLLEAGLIDTKSCEPRRKVLEIWNRIEELAAKFKPDYIILEKIFFGENRKTALSVAEVRGILMLKSALLGCEFLEFAPNEVKNTVTGYGHASKEVVENIVLKTLKIEKIDGPDDVSDAVAVALTGAFHIKDYGKGLTKYSDHIA